MKNIKFPPSFELIESEYIDEISSNVFRFIHKQTGAHVLFVSNSNPYKMFDISFLTSPDNNTGIAHILEHCVLAGSRKYPIGSYENISQKLSAGYTNGATSSDHTDFYFSAKKDEEFFTCMDMYLDMVFYPLFLKDKNIFLREGWRLEVFENEAGEPEFDYNGIVLNEMKAKDDGYFQAARLALRSELEPGSCYGYYSGGKSCDIPDCTYEDLIEFYNYYYKASNAHIYLYGDMDIERTLEFLDKEYLSYFDKNESFRLTPTKNQKKTILKKKSIPTTQEEERVYLCGVLFDEKVRPEQALAFSLFEEEMECAVERELSRLGLGDAARVYLEQSAIQDYLHVTVYSQIPGAGKDVYEAVNNALRKDLDRDEEFRASLSAKINRHELLFWENMYDAANAGNVVFELISNYWLYNEKYIVDVLHVSDNLQYIKNRIWGKSYKALICEEMPADCRMAVIECIPLVKAKSVFSRLLYKKLEQKTDSLSRTEFNDLMIEQEEFDHWEKETSDRSQQKVWNDTIEEIRDDEEILQIPYRTETVSDITFYHIPIAQSKVVWLTLSFDADRYKEHIEELELLVDLFNKRGFGDFYGLDPIEAKQLLTSYLQARVKVNRGYDLENNGCHVRAEFSFCALRENIADVIKIIFRMMFDVFIAVPGYGQTLAMKAERLQDDLIDSSNDYNTVLAGVSIDEKCWLLDRQEGLAFLDFIKNFGESGKAAFDCFYKNCYAMLNDIFNNENLCVFCSADDRGYDAVKKAMTRRSFADIRSEMFQKLKNDYNDAISRERDYEDRKELRYWQGFIQKYKGNTEIIDWYNVDYRNSNQCDRAVIIPSRVNYIAFYGGIENSCHYREENVGVLRIVAYLLENRYLQHELREVGGAYGAVVSIYDSGYLSMKSYRDPNLKRTMDIMRCAPDYIESLEIHDEELEEIKIKLIDEMADTNTNTPWDDQYEVRSIEITKRPVNLDQEILKQIRACTPEDIRSAADVIRKMIERGYFCVFGNESDINHNNELFGQIRSLVD